MMAESGLSMICECKNHGSEFANTGRMTKSCKYYWRFGFWLLNVETVKNDKDITAEHISKHIIFKYIQWHGFTVFICLGSLIKISWGSWPRAYIFQWENEIVPYVKRQHTSGSSLTGPDNIFLLWVWTRLVPFILLAAVSTGWRIFSKVLEESLPLLVSTVRYRANMFQWDTWRSAGGITVLSWHTAMNPCTPI